MNILPSKLPGVRIIQPDVFGDSRGFFLETWSARRYAEHLGPVTFVQDNISFSRRGILRGLHFQKPNAQGKLVMVLTGKVFDVALDIRRHSPTFGQWEVYELSGENKHQVYLPPGIAHGFQVVSDSALFHYKCTAYYSAADEHAVSWNDPDLAIPCPLPDPILSAKDLKGQRLCHLPPELLFDLP
jgi:dTDP-4-dehydrorhamnose 3,5-epimerase